MPDELTDADLEELLRHQWDAVGSHAVPALIRDLRAANAEIVMHKAIKEGFGDALADAENERERLATLLERCKDALRPFAEEAKVYSWQNNVRAAALLAELEGKDDG